MSWVEFAALSILFVGLGAGAFLVAQRPSFWAALASSAVKAALPAAISVLTKRMPPDQEKAWRDCQKRGGKWNHLKRRCE